MVQWTEGNLPPQDHDRVVLGSQYAVLAKNVYGLNEDICAIDRVVMLCRFRSEGAAWTASAVV